MVTADVKAPSASDGATLVHAIRKPDGAQVVTYISMTDFYGDPEIPAGGRYQP